MYISSLYYATCISFELNFSNKGLWGDGGWFDMATSGVWKEWFYVTCEIIFAQLDTNFLIFIWLVLTINNWAQPIVNLHVNVVSQDK